jgi:hypothetical protein
MESGHDKEKSQEKQQPPFSDGEITNNTKIQDATQSPIQGNTTQAKENNSQQIRAEIKQLLKEELKVSKEESAEAAATIKLVKWTKPLTIANAIIALCALVGIGITLEQIHEANKTTANTFIKMQNAINSLNTMANADSVLAESTKKSVIDNDSMLQVSKLALGNSEKSFEVENRASIYLVQENIKIDSDSKGIISIYSVGFNNVGKTPAHNVFARFFCDTTFKGNSSFNKLIINDTVGIMQAASIEPIGYNGRIKNPIKIEDFLQWRKSLFIYGDITYFDFLNQKHYVRFCYRITTEIRYKDTDFSKAKLANKLDRFLMMKARIRRIPITQYISNN